MGFNRRNFLKWGAAYLAASGVFDGDSRRTLAQIAPMSTRGAEPLMLSVSARDLGQQISPDFLGLSFEAAAVADPAFLRPKNHSLLTLLENLNSRGVIRIGGNTSDFTQFQPDVGAAFDLAPGASQHRKKVTMLVAADIRQLAEFVRSANWSLIWGVNLGTGSPQQAAEEAAVVASAMEYALLAIQIGNEPNLYRENGLRGASYGFPAYLTEWHTYAQAIQTRVPGVPLAGPDSAGDARWFMQMADQAAADLSLLTQHHYAEGPGSSPTSTIDRMLSAKSAEKQLAQTLRDIAGAAGLPYRMSETNSCYGGGRYGVSDTLAAALWAVNYLFTLAAGGCSGVNFHGGPTGAYTPIARAVNGVDYEPRPLYYAMLLFASVSNGHIVRAHFATPAPASVTAYAVRHDTKELSVIVINSDATRSADIMVDAGAGYTQGGILRLSGPSLTATTDIAFGNAAVNTDGSWQPKTTESVLPRNGLFALTVSAASVATLHLS